MLDSLIIDVARTEKDDPRTRDWFEQEVARLAGEPVELVQSNDEVLREIAALGATRGPGGSTGLGLVRMPSSDKVSRPSNRDQMLFDQLQRELVSTEQRFIEKMALLEQYFVKPLKETITSRPASPGRGSVETVPRISQWDFDHTFGKVTPLLHAQQSFYKSLRAVNDGQADLFDVLQCQFTQKSRSLIDYIENYADSLRVIEKLQKTHASFASFVKAQQDAIEQERRQYIDLQSLLIEPVQRIARYSLLAEKMMACLYHPENAALAEIIKVLNHLGSLHTDQRSKLLQVMMNLPSTVAGFPSDAISGQMLQEVIDIVHKDAQGHEQRATLLVLSSAIAIASRTGPVDGPTLVGLATHARFHGSLPVHHHLSPKKASTSSSTLRFSHLVPYSCMELYGPDSIGNRVKMESTAVHETARAEDWIFDSQHTRDRLLHRVWHAQASEHCRAVSRSARLVRRMDVAHPDRGTTTLWFVSRESNTCASPYSRNIIAFAPGLNSGERITLIELELQSHGMKIQTRQTVKHQMVPFHRFIASDDLSELWSWLSTQSRARTRHDVGRSSPVKQAMSTKLSNTWRAMSPSSPRHRASSSRSGSPNLSLSSSRPSTQCGSPSRTSYSTSESGMSLESRKYMLSLD